MTDEDRQKLIARFRAREYFMWTDIDLAASEIERLAARVNALEHIIDLDMYEATKNALVQEQEKSERLAKEVKDAKELIINLLNKAKEYMDD